MIISSTTLPNAGALPPEKLLHAREISEADKVQELSRQFEAVLLRKILSDAHKPLLGDGLMGEGSTSGIYQDLMVAQLADQIASARSLGIAQGLEQELTPRGSGPAAAGEKTGSKS